MTVNANVRMVEQLRGVAPAADCARTGGTGSPAQSRSDIYHRAFSWYRLTFSQVNR